MQVMKNCLKCGYQRLPTDLGPEISCPECGAIYAKVEATLAEKLRQQARQSSMVSDRSATSSGTPPTTSRKPVEPQEEQPPQRFTDVVSKGPDEKFCSECAAVIKAKAEICPKCGVRQMPAPVSAPRKAVIQSQAGGSKSLLSCPKCGEMAKKGGYPQWVPWVCVCLFPVGLVALLTERNPTECPSCGHTWQA